MFEGYTLPPEGRHEKAEKIWLDGKLVAFDDAKVHVLTHALHYGVGVFEGIRAYKTAGRALGRLPPPRAHAAALRLGAHRADGDPVPAGAARAGLPRGARARTGSPRATSGRSPSSAPARWASAR